MSFWQAFLLVTAAVLAVDIVIGLATGRTRILLSADKANEPRSFFPILAMGALGVAVLAWGGLSSEF